MLAQIKDWLDTESEVVLPRSPLGQAITYARNQWTALTRVHHARLPQHRQQRQRAGLKRVAIGRKNWLFAGNDAAAEKHARL